MFKLFIAAALICGLIENIQNEENNLSPYNLYTDLNSIIKVLEDPKVNNITGVKELIELYNKSVIKRKEFVSKGGSKKHPLIVIEGLSGSGKSSVSTILTKIINATKVHSPNEDFEKLKEGFLEYPVLNNAYHQLSHYVTSNDILPVLQNTPVILDRYYPSSNTFSIVKTMVKNKEIPPRRSKVYRCPEGMLKPDIIIFLFVDEEERLRRISHRVSTEGVPLGENEIVLQNDSAYRQNLLLAYQYLIDPEVTFVDANKSLNDTVKAAYEAVKPYL